ncbi:glycosyltransferase family 4 protein [Pedobacter sp. SD-b]|uniref:Glycosyltransferase family 4 protein n=1 Tax=Pedobacter segetis TaxID=2793069 RepID=A0ABS1BMI7_9SPHI|nr:glycosyltransferase family 1 protein [Pedobacter segetis]MBK0384104.1 glycosyltransferase family 4 protein [Pedobacter segetis]
MRIAVNTRLLQKGKLEGIGRFTDETLKRMVINHPQVEFIFCFDRGFDASFIYGDNVKPIVIWPQARHPFLYYIWFKWCLPFVLKREKIDLLLSMDGFLPLDTNVKTLSVIHDLAFEHFPNAVPWLTQKYYKYFFPRFAKKASRIATVSSFTKNDLIKTYQINPQKIDVVFNGVSSVFKPMKEEEKLEIVKNEIGGKPYFICLGSIHPRKNIITLLKAFEKFKIRNPQDAHQLLFVGRMGWQNNEVENYFKEMTFKDDVLFKGFLKDEQIAKLLASAKASVYPSLFEGFGLPVIESMACGTPVITSRGTSMEEIAKGAAFLFDAKNVDELTKHLENQASGNGPDHEKIVLGLAIAEEYNWDKTAGLLWESILNVGIKDDWCLVGGERCSVNGNR